MASNTTGVLSTPGNAVPMTGLQSWTPTIAGATDNPVATYALLLARFTLINNLCFFKYFFTTTTMAKTTLTDPLLLALPIPAATNTNSSDIFPARIENSTAVANAAIGLIASGSSNATFRNYATAASTAAVTYAVAAPGIGVLTNTITFQGNGMYEF